MTPNTRGSTPDDHCFREESPTPDCDLCGEIAGKHTGCDCEEDEQDRIGARISL